MRAFSRIAAVALWLAVTGSAAAHRGQDALSTVEIDLASGQVIVTHYLTAHDTEPALSEIAPEAQPSLDDPEAVAALTAYAAKRFLLEESAGPVALVLEKVDLAGDNVQLVYHGRMQAPASPLRVQARLLIDIYPNQRIQVNVRRGNVMRTLQFGPESEAQTLPGIQART